MFLTNFSHKYPELAEKEFNTIQLEKNPFNLPSGNYVIEEMYCTDPKCDCRKVTLLLLGPENINCCYDFGFDTPEHYKKWGMFDKDMAREMSGLSINNFSGNPDDSERFFQMMETILGDYSFVDRIKKRYTMMKEKVDGFQNMLGDVDLDTEYYSLEDPFEKGKKATQILKTQRERQKKKQAKKQKQLQRKRSK